MGTVKRRASMMLLGAALVLASVLFLMAAPATAHADTGQQVLNEANQAAGKNAFTLIEGGELLKSMEQATQAGFASADTVVLVTSEGYWDGVAAMSLAGAQNAPVLFVYKDGVPGQTASEIRRLGATNAIIVGNTESVGAAVEEQLGTLGLNVRRIAGSSYADTANAVAQALGEAASNTCLIASGNGYWDCMCATSYSYATKSPVFFASDSISPATLNAVKAGGYSQAVILGGTAAVSNKAETQLKDLGLNVIRLSGFDAYKTAVSFANWALEQGMTVNNMAVADINGYLTGTLAGPLAGKANSVVLYGADSRESLRTSTADFIKEQAAQINSGYVLGAIANPNWNPTPKTPWQDMSGETAVDTMASIVQAGWQDNCGGTVIVSNISGYWDALAASALAGATGAPVLLTDGNGFWDALSGAALCGKNNAILILVPHDDGVFAYDPYCINKIVKPNAQKIKKSCVFGGLAAIPQATRDALSAALG